MLGFKLILTFLYPAIVLLAGIFMGYNMEALRLLPLLALIHSGGHLLMFFRAQFQALQAFRLDGYASVLERVILLLLTWTLLFVSINLNGFIAVRLISIGASTLLLYLALVRNYGLLIPALHLPTYTKILRESFPFALIIVLYAVHDKIDQVMLERMVGEHETSLYAAAYRWMDAAGMYLWTVLPIFFARFAKVEGDEGEIHKLLRQGQLISALPLVFVSVFVFFQGERLMFLFTQSNAAEIATMTQALKILFIALGFNSIIMIYSTLLTATGYVNFVNRFFIAGILVNVLMNLWLIPSLGAIAAAWSTVASMGVMGLAYIGYTHFKLPVKVPYDLLGKILVLIALISLAYWGLLQVGLPWWLSGILAGSVYLLLCAGLGFIPFKRN